MDFALSAKLASIGSVAGCCHLGVYHAKQAQVPLVLSAKDDLTSGGPEHDRIAEVRAVDLDFVTTGSANENA